MTVRLAIRPRENAVPPPLVSPRLGLVRRPQMKLSLRLSITLWLTSIATVPLAAQSARSGSPDAGDRQEPALIVGSDQTVAALSSRAGKNPTTQAAAVNSLARIQRLREAGELLASLPIPEGPPADLAAIGRQIEPAMRLRLLASAEVGDAARQTLRKLNAAIEAVRNDPKRAAADVTTVANGGEGRLSAVRRLAGGGPAAVQAIVHHLLRTDQTDSIRDLLAIGLRADAKMEEALSIAVRFASPATAVRAAELLRIIDPNRYDDWRQLALARRDDAPLSESVRDRWRQRFVRARDRSLSAAADETAALAWTWDGETQSVRFSRTTVLQAHYLDAVADAAAVRSIAGVQPEILQQTWLSELGYRVLIDPDWGDASQVESFVDSRPRLLEPSTLAAVTRLAVAEDDSVGLLGVIRLIDGLFGRDANRTDPPDRSNPSVAPELIAAVSDAAKHSLPIIRYEAALVADTIAAATTHAGSPTVRRTLAEMTRLADRPAVLILETRPGFATHLQRLGIEAGYQAELLSSARDLLDRMAAGGDVRAVLSKTQIADLSPIEMVDRIRRMPEGRTVPIIFFDDPAIDDEVGLFRSTDVSEPAWPVVLDRWEHPAHQIAFPKTAAPLNRILDVAGDLSRVPPLTPLDRRAFATLATERLEKLPR